MTRMTRRDRAALVLAYECVRSPDAHDEHGDPAPGSMLRALDLGGPTAWQLHEAQSYSEPWAVEARLERARYALTIRALLRADAGDCGEDRWTACGCGATVYITPEDTLRCEGCERDVPITAAAFRAASRRITPAWSRAPATGTATRPSGLKRRP